MPYAEAIDWVGKKDNCSRTEAIRQIREAVADKVIRDLRWPDERAGSTAVLDFYPDYPPTHRQFWTSDDSIPDKDGRIFDPLTKRRRELLMLRESVYRIAKSDDDPRAKEDALSDQSKTATAAAAPACVAVRTTFSTTTSWPITQSPDARRAEEAPESKGNQPAKAEAGSESPSECAVDSQSSSPRNTASEQRRLEDEPWFGELRPRAQEAARRINQLKVAGKLPTGITQPDLAARLTKEAKNRPSFSKRIVSDAVRFLKSVGCY